MDLINFIANMRGPKFLSFYITLAGVSVIIIAIAKYWVEKGRSGPLPPVPPEPDPLEIGFLRGGLFEVFNQLLFELVHRGFLNRKADGLVQARRGPSARHLDKPMRKIFDAFDKDKVLKPKDALKDKKVMKELESICAPYIEWAKREELLTPRTRINNFKILRNTIVLSVLSVGGFKLFTALSRGRHNVGFLILLMVVFAVIGWSIGGNFSRLSRRGRRYIENLQLAFARLEDQESIWAERDDEALLLAYGVFGASIFAVGTYAFFHDMVHHAAYDAAMASASAAYSDHLTDWSWSSSSCSSSWGSSGGGCGSSCGSSCGSGCGGCGGCGG